MKKIVLLLVIQCTVYADQIESNYIDDTHKAISKKVVDWSNALDTTLNDWVKDKEEEDVKDTEDNATDLVSELPVNTLEEKVNYVDTFFQSDKYLEETENTFVRVRTGGYFQSKDSSDFDVSLSAQMPFKKSRKNIKIFIENMNADNAGNVLQDKTESPDIGINYFRPEKFGLNSKYSLGFSGIHPFTRARYNLPFSTNEWLIDASQSFKYSTKNKFEEETNIYFDRELPEKKLLRLQLHRKTQEEIDGMEYIFSAQYYCCRKKNTGLRFSQMFIGHTKYQYTVDTGTLPLQEKTFGGINNYVSAVTWRRNIWRKWFYYEVSPAVSFEKQYEYEPNYTIRLSFDFYLGKYN